MGRTARPNGQIWMHAEQFHDVAELLYRAEDGDLNRLALPLIVNYALCAKLAMKSAEGVTHYGAVIDGIIGTGTIGSGVHGHDLATRNGPCGAPYSGAAAPDTRRMRPAPPTKARFFPAP